MGMGGGAVQHLPLPPCNVRSFNHSMQCGARWTRLENPASVRANWTDLAGGDVGGAGHETEGHGPGSARPRVVLPPSAGLGRSRPRKAGEEPPRVSGVQPHQQLGGVPAKGRCSVGRGRGRAPAAQGPRGAARRGAGGAAGRAHSLAGAGGPRRRAAESAPPLAAGRGGEEVRHLTGGEDGRADLLAWRWWWW